MHYLFSCDKAIEGGCINKWYWAPSSRTLLSCRLLAAVSAHWRLSQNWAIDKLSPLPGVFCYLIRERCFFLRSRLCAHVSGLRELCSLFSTSPSTYLKSTSSLRCRVGGMAQARDRLVGRQTKKHELIVMTSFREEGKIVWIFLPVFEILQMKI